MPSRVATGEERQVHSDWQRIFPTAKDSVHLPCLRWALLKMKLFLKILCWFMTGAGLIFALIGFAFFAGALAHLAYMGFMDGWKLIPYSSLPYVAPVANVKLFGAMGDGVTDDTAAIQSAIDAANYSNGVPKTVWLPPGVYWIGGTNELKIRPNVGGNGNPGDRSAATNGYDFKSTKP